MTQNPALWLVLRPDDIKTNKKLKTGWTPLLTFNPNLEKHQPYMGNLHAIVWRQRGPFTCHHQGPFLLTKTVDRQDFIKPTKRDFGPSLYLLHVGTNDISLKDTPEAISKRIIATAESLKKKHTEVAISTIVVRGDDLKEKGKTLSNILITECKIKNIRITNHLNNINPQRHLNQSRLHFNSHCRSIIVKNIKDFLNNVSVSNWPRKRDNLSSIASSPFLNDTSCLGFSNLFKQPANDLTNIKKSMFEWSKHCNNSSP